MDLEKIGKSIAAAREKSGMSQAQLAERIGVSVQAVSKWETGRNLPEIDHLKQIAEITDVPYSALLDESDGDGAETLSLRERLFREENMYMRMRATAQTEGFAQTYRALPYMRERHEGQFRKKRKYSSEQVRYINHPLLMACQAYALGIRDDALLAAVLLHDVVEDTGVRADELPFDDEVRELVELVSFCVPEGMTKLQAKEEYFARIAENGKACLIKLLDRCNNVSTMAGVFPRKKMLEYIEETEKYILPLANVLKQQYLEYGDAAFLLKYHIVSVIEAIKNLTAN
ncbi:MAG: helix-turn-helix domain-containing protein [Clostridia bacterium]|nr:helix-turn-helix domain-containing protein [Clostridia bacterium]